MESLKAYVATFLAEIRDELKVTEPDIAFVIENASLPEQVLSSALQADLLDTLYACPHGVIAMSREIQNFVETSTNLASVKFIDNKIVITTSQRSSVESSKKDVCDMVASVFYLLHADVVQSSGYPGWKPDPGSEVLKISVDAYRRLFKQEPEVLAIHAGLECGLFYEKFRGIDMISFGPSIKGAHTPEEKIEIRTVKMFWDLLIDVIKHIPERNT